MRAAGRASAWWWSVLCRSDPGRVQRRQKMPHGGQNIPTNYLKNNQNTAPDRARTDVQHDEARLVRRQRRCGLEDGA